MSSFNSFVYFNLNIYWERYLFAMLASLSGNSPPATACQAGTSRHLLLPLHLDGETRKSGQKNISSEHVIFELCVMSIHTRLTMWHSLSGTRWTTGAEVEQGEAKYKEDREGQTCHVWYQRILQDRTQWHTLYCCERNQKHCGQLNIYWPSVCLSGYLPCIGSNCLFFSKHQEEVREVKGWGGK